MATKKAMPAARGNPEFHFAEHTAEGPDLAGEGPRVARGAQELELVFPARDVRLGIMDPRPGQFADPFGAGDAEPEAEDDERDGELRPEVLEDAVDGAEDGVVRGDEGERELQAGFGESSRALEIALVDARDLGSTPMSVPGTGTGDRRWRWGRAFPLWRLLCWDFLVRGVLGDHRALLLLGVPAAFQF